MKVPTINELKEIIKLKPKVNKFMWFDERFNAAIEEERAALEAELREQAKKLTKTEQHFFSTTISSSVLVQQAVLAGSPEIRKRFEQKL